MNEQIKKEIMATFDDDTKRMHRFTIDEGQGVKGIVFVPKDSEVPDVLIVRLSTKAEAEKQKSSSSMRGQR